MLEHEVEISPPGMKSAVVSVVWSEEDFARSFFFNPWSITSILSIALRHRVGFLGYSVQGEELDLMTRLHPFQPRMSCDSMVSMVLLVLLMFKVLFSDPVPGT